MNSLEKNCRRYLYFILKLEMNYADDMTLEDGRIALYQLEKQLKVSSSAVPDTSENSVGSRLSERRMLDQVSRDARLHNRKGSPLGLTIEV